jgi:oligopeptide/dipeptide ABC transporter ATP-binding protein
MDAASLLNADGLSVQFATRTTSIRALSGVSISVDHGASLGIVGESASGKSVLCRSVQGLIPDDIAMSRGRVVYRPGPNPDGARPNPDARPLSINLAQTPSGSRLWHHIRGKTVGYVSQLPRESLDPYLEIGRQMLMTARVLGLPREERREISMHWLERVGLAEPDRVFKSLPRELSGGMCQRVAIALALMGKPSLLIADEPTSNLDSVSRQRLVELLATIRSEDGLALLFVSHNMGLVAELCETVAVLYSGVVLESGSTSAVTTRPVHPYTRALVRSVPRLHGARRTTVDSGSGDPREGGKPDECPYLGRCKLRQPSCASSVPEMGIVRSGTMGDDTQTHRARCPVVLSAFSGGAT